MVQTTETRERLKALLKSRFPPRATRGASKRGIPSNQVAPARALAGPRLPRTDQFETQCGSIQKGWVNTDFDIECRSLFDGRETPTGRGYATIIYSEQFFEHLDYPVDAKHFLHECHRVLERGGIISKASLKSGVHRVVALSTDKDSMLSEEARLRIFWQLMREVNLVGFFPLARSIRPARIIKVNVS